jgi:hypothetical protein
MANIQEAFTIYREPLNTLIYEKISDISPLGELVSNFNNPYTYFISFRNNKIYRTHNIQKSDKLVLITNEFEIQVLKSFNHLN